MRKARLVSDMLTEDDRLYIRQKRERASAKESAKESMKAFELSKYFFALSQRILEKSLFDDIPDREILEKRKMLVNYLLTNRLLKYKDVPQVLGLTLSRLPKILDGSPSDDFAPRTLGVVKVDRNVTGTYMTMPDEGKAQGYLDLVEYLVK